jgi:thioredoxin-dependent peroxiredoxin
MLTEGQDAPDFTLVDAKGDSHRLADALAEGPVVLAFMKTSCGTCTLAFPYLERLHQAYPSPGWQIWAICQDPATAAESFAGKTGVTFPMLIEGDGYPVSQAYDPPATPTIFLVDREGAIRSGHYGLAKPDLNALAEQVAAVLGEQPVVVAPSNDGIPDFKPG